jgi:hypothetical protein
MLAASFNRSAWFAKGEVVSTEMRALHSAGGVRPFVNGFNPYRVGLTGYGPNINLMRDPRWGRNCEVPSEDPFLAGEYANQYVTGCQTGPDPRYLKMSAGACAGPRVRARAGGWGWGWGRSSGRGGAAPNGHCAVAHDMMPCSGKGALPPQLPPLAQRR